MTIDNYFVRFTLPTRWIIFNDKRWFTLLRKISPTRFNDQHQYCNAENCKRKKNEKKKSSDFVEEKSPTHSWCMRMTYNATMRVYTYNVSNVIPNTIRFFGHVSIIFSTRENSPKWLKNVQNESEFTCSRCQIDSILLNHIFCQTQEKWHNQFQFDWHKYFVRLNWELRIVICASLFVLIGGMDDIWVQPPNIKIDVFEKNKFYSVQSRLLSRIQDFRRNWHQMEKQTKIVSIFRSEFVIFVANHSRQM